MVPEGECQCRLLALPAELLLRVTEYVVPPSGILHVTRQKSISALQRQEYSTFRPFTHVTHFTEHLDRCLPASGAVWNDGPTLSGTLALARTCRRLNDVFCTVLYGGNWWLFELTDSVYPWHKLLILAGGLKCWSRLHTHSAVADAGARCWPLTQHTAQDVRDVSVLVSGDSFEEAEMQVKTEGVLSLFQEGLQLRSLAVDIMPLESRFGDGRKWLVVEVGPGREVTLEHSSERWENPWVWKISARRSKS